MNLFFFISKTDFSSERIITVLRISITNGDKRSQDLFSSQNVLGFAYILSLQKTSEHFITMIPNRLFKFSYSIYLSKKKFYILEFHGHITLSSYILNKYQFVHEKLKLHVASNLFFLLYRVVHGKLTNYKIQL